MGITSRRVWLWLGEGSGPGGGGEETSVKGRLRLGDGFCWTGVEGVQS